MKAAYLFLPVLAILTVAVLSAVASAFSAIAWIKYLGWALGFSMLALWVYLDFKNFKDRFSSNRMKYGAGSGVVVVLVLALLAALANITNRARFNKQVDLTNNSLNTLSDDSVRLVERLVEEKVRISVDAFFQDDVIKDKFMSNFALYKHKGLLVDENYIDPRVSPDKAISAKITSPNTVVFRVQAREASITNFSEEKITNALVNVSKDKPKKIYFLTGHGEPTLRGDDGDAFGLATTVLEGQKYQIEELSLIESSEIPSDAAEMLILAGMKYDLKQPEARIIDEYLATGGAMLIAVDAVVSIPRLNSVLEKYNIEIENDFLILAPDDLRAQMFGQNFTVINNFDEMSGVTKDLAGKGNELLVPFVRSLNLSEKNKDFNAIAAAKTSDIMVQISDVEEEEDLKNLDESRMEAGSFNVLAVSSGKVSGKNQDDENRTSRIVVFGSSHFMNNQGIQLSGANTDLLGE